MKSSKNAGIILLAIADMEGLMWKLDQRRGDLMKWSQKHVRNNVIVIEEIH